MFDTHCHLQDRRIAEDSGNIIRNARRAGVGRMLCCGCEPPDWTAVARIGTEHNEITQAFGIHPLYIDRAPNDWEESLKNYLATTPAAAVGEIGLDNAVTPRNDPKQIDFFVRQLKIASEYKRPVSIHCRNAWGNLIKILRDLNGLKYGGVIHSYSGAPDLVDTLQKLNCCISFSGAILNDRNKRAAESLKRVAPDRLLIETDSPDLLPRGTPGPHNVPANLPIIRDKVAQILGKTPEDIAAITYDNGVRIFS